MKNVDSPNYKWIYTYDYAPNQTWDKWRTSHLPASWIDEECEKTSKRVKKDLLKFALLADTHYVINGTWEDTAYSLGELHEIVGLDGVIHLGDITDGMLPIAQTYKFESQIRDDLQFVGVPVYYVPGNHDYNYFKGNEELQYPEKPQYYVDLDKQKLRLIFLDSFDPKEQLRYGFTDYCVNWLDATMNLLPNEYSAIVFSHITPLVRLQAWAKEIRNREKLMAVLNKYADKILAFINGHNHCDHLFNDLYNGKFPIVSINCAKCEYFLEHKPEGAVVPYRELGSKTQESFDIMQIDASNRIIYFTRFGAGNDRIIENGKARWV